jgi:hypothetical protein
MPSGCYQYISGGSWGRRSTTRSPPARLGRPVATSSAPLGWWFSQGGCRAAVLCGRWGRFRASRPGAFGVPRRPERGSGCRSESKTVIGSQSLQGQEWNRPGFLEASTKTRGRSGPLDSSTSRTRLRRDERGRRGRYGTPSLVLLRRSASPKPAAAAAPSPAAGGTATPRTK